VKQAREWKAACWRRVGSGAFQSSNPDIGSRISAYVAGTYEGRGPRGRSITIGYPYTRKCERKVELRKAQLYVEHARETGKEEDFVAAARRDPSARTRRRARVAAASASAAHANRRSGNDAIRRRCHSRERLRRRHESVPIGFR
jgi:hypothetical protein